MREPPVKSTSKDLAGCGLGKVICQLVVTVTNMSRRITVLAGLLSPGLTQLMQGFHETGWPVDI